MMRKNPATAPRKEKTGPEISLGPARRLFFDYNFYTGTRSSYEYVTTFYPLWAGVANSEQAQELVHNLAYSNSLEAWR